MKKIVEWTTDDESRFFTSYDEARRFESHLALKHVIASTVAGRISAARIVAELMKIIPECQEILAGLLSREMLAEELERRVQEKV